VYQWDVLVLVLQGDLVPNEFVPKVGLKFDTLEGAYEYYCDYTKLAGFDVRKGREGKARRFSGSFATRVIATVRIWRKN
jgi:hypothetical protein